MGVDEGDDYDDCHDHRVHHPLAGLPRGRALTRDDLDAMPDDGHRYELIDGILVVSPVPRIRHQDVVAEVYVLLRAACPVELKVLFAPVDVALSEDTVMQPDLLVAGRADFTAAICRPLPSWPSRCSRRAREPSTCC